jgi:hypothetical protein
MSGSLIGLEEFGRSNRLGATLLLKFGFQEVKWSLGGLDPSAEGHLLSDEDGFAIAHLKLSGHSDMSMRKETIGHGAIEQRGDHAPVKASLEAFKRSVAVERRAHATVLFDAVFQS